MSRLGRYRCAYIITDLCTTLGAWILFNLLRYGIEEQALRSESLWAYLLLPNTLLSTFGVLTSSVVIYILSGYYNKPYAKSRMLDLVTSLCSAFLLSILVFFLIVSDDVLPSTSLYLRVYFVLLGCLFFPLYIGRSLVTYVLLQRTLLEEHKRRVLLIEEGQIGKEVGEWLVGEGKMSLVGRVALPPCNPTSEVEAEHKQCLVAMMQEVRQIALDRDAEEVVVATTSYGFSAISDLLYALYPLGLPIRLSPRSIPYVGIKLRVSTMLGEPLVEVTACNMSEASQNIKWLADRVLALVGLVALSPLLLYIAYRTARSSEGAVIYSQERIGYRGRPFMIYKFRSMYSDAEVVGPQLSRDGDERITPWGRVMRQYRLDELPQLWNVLRGDMSLVGPRPERAYYIEQLMADAPQLCLLHNVRPGITSWAMVRYGYASSLSEMQERMAYDFLYYENMSLRLDLLTLFYTVQTIVKGKGK